MKSVGTLLVTRPTHRGLRIAQSDRTSNTEAHAVHIYKYVTRCQTKTDYNNERMYKTHP